MTPEDIHFIKAIGNSILSNIASVIAHTFIYGVFSLLFCISTVIFIRRGLTTRTQWMMLIISVFCFALFSLFWIVGVMLLVIFVKSILVDNIALPNVDSLTLYNIKTQSIGLIGEVIAEIFPLISDMIVVWRAWTIFPTRRGWMIGPIFLLISATIITILHILSVFGRVPALINNVSISNGMWAATSAASVACNLSATLLISYNLWDHRKHVSGNLGHQKSRTQGEKVLAVLVESGVIYCMIQVVTLVLRIIYANTQRESIIYAYDIFTVVYIGASAMYPIIVVVLVRLQLSFEHTYGFSLVSNAQDDRHNNTSHPPTIGQLRFATTPDDSGENGKIFEEGRGKSNDWSSV